MMHAKTAVADGRWARVGSSNLNVSSWLGNYELDVTIEDEGFAREMEAFSTTSSADRRSCSRPGAARPSETRVPPPRRRRPAPAA
jgi:cardiolipin synthase